jgi:protein-S-isoprenylcysteine O-methyltransferase Ste14
MGRRMKWIDLPPVWLALFAAMGWAQAAWVPVGSFGAAGDWVGAALVAAGLGLALAAAVEFRRARTTIIPHGTPAAIVTSGVYRLSRNPIYLGDALILTGLGLRWDSALALVLVPVFVAVITARFIRPEEARLEAHFGAEYAAWAARVRRWA